MSFSSMQSIDREDGEEMSIYANVAAVNNVCRRTDDSDTTRNQTFQHTESENVRMRSYRSVTVCLVLLCVLLLTAVIVLCVLINTNNQQCYPKSKNLTEERDQLITNNTNLTEERNQLLFKYKTMTKEKDELLINNNKQTEKINKLWKTLNAAEGWIYYQSSFYFISFEKKSWTESRRYCREKGADLIIINNRQEQEFIKSNYGNDRLWIGLTDSDVEGKWKWVDNSTLNFDFWRPGDPNNHGGNEDCVETESAGWADFPCTDAFKWICERKILK